MRDMGVHWQVSVITASDHCRNWSEWMFQEVDAYALVPFKTGGQGCWQAAPHQKCLKKQCLHPCKTLVPAGASSVLLVAFPVLLVLFQSCWCLFTSAAAFSALLVPLLSYWSFSTSTGAPSALLVHLESCLRSFHACLHCLRFLHLPQLVASIN